MVPAFAPANVNLEVKFVQMHHDALNEVVPGDNLGFSVKKVSVNGIKREMVAGDSKKDPTNETKNFLAEVFVMNHPGEIHSGYQPALDCHTVHILWNSSDLKQKIDRQAGNVLEENLKMNPLFSVNPLKSIQFPHTIKLLFWL